MALVLLCLIETSSAAAEKGSGGMGRYRGARLHLVKPDYMEGVWRLTGKAEAGTLQGAFAV